MSFSDPTADTITWLSWTERDHLVTQEVTAARPIPTHEWPGAAARLVYIPTHGWVGVRRDQRPQEADEEATPQR